MDFGILFNPQLSQHSADTTLDVIFWIGIDLLFLTLFLFSLILLLRVSLIQGNRRKQALVARWMPILEGCLNHGFPETVPKLHPSELFTFLSMWLNLYETSDESSREILVMVALQAGLESCINRQLTQRNEVRRKIILLSAIGAIKNTEWQAFCLSSLHSENAFLSLAGARALLQMDPDTAVPLVLELLAKRTDWPSARVSMLLLEAGLPLISTRLANMVREAPADDLPRLIPYLRIITADAAIPVLETLLSNPQYRENEPVLLASLQALGKFSRFGHTDTIRGFLSHPNAGIRAEAATAVSRVGRFEDGKYLVGLLNDEVPMVQYKAAQALLNLPSMNEANVKALQTLLDKPDAVAMLNRVIGEKRFQR